MLMKEFYIEKAAVFMLFSNPELTKTYIVEIMIPHLII